MEGDVKTGHGVRSRWWRRSALLLLIALAVHATILTSKWPFTREKILEGLGKSTSSEVRAERVNLTFFPWPGCVLEGVTVEGPSRSGPVRLATAQRLKVEGSWGALLMFRRYLHALRAEGLHVLIPGSLPEPVQNSDAKKSETKIGEMTAHGAVLEISGESSAKPIRFEFSRFAIDDFARDQPIKLAMQLKNPEPPGDLSVRGTFGPWNGADRARTPVSGSFELSRADLSKYSGIAGLLSINGKMEGELGGIRVQGQASVPDFEVNKNKHQIPVKADYTATVNGLTGDVALTAAQANFRNTVLIATGTVHSPPSGSGKVLELDFDGRRVRIEDLLWMFTRSNQPALEGPITLRAHVVLPPGEGKFIRKVRLDGTFDINDAEFGRARTQAKVNELSARARTEEGADKKTEKQDDKHPRRVASDLSGRVILRDGVARLSNVKFGVPGAVATGGGTYNLLTKAVDLRGKMAMDASVSDASGGGLKSMLLKPFDFLFRKGPADAVLPVSVVGQYPRPKFQVGPSAK